jgi:hypothetical protein
LKPSRRFLIHLTPELAGAPSGPTGSLEEMDMRTACDVPAIPFGRTLAAAAMALAVAVSTAAAQTAPPPFAQSLTLAPGVQRAADYAPPKTQYVVVNGATLYRTPWYEPGQETGETLQRGQRPEVLAEAADGLWLLIGKDGKGIGYASRGLVCPAALCPDVKG